jgi:hypothetical protein
MKRSFIFAVMGLAALMFVLPAMSDDKIQRYSVAVKPAPATGGTRKLEFKYGDIRGWLREDGFWEVEGLVSHNRLLCSTYQLGLRFGHGAPACVNVEWLSEPEYISSNKQCNNATMMHKGGGQLDIGFIDNDGGQADDEIPAKMDIEKITCTQIHIKCTGRCN